MSKPFFYRIEAGALIDFATDEEGQGITLLRFAKDLQKGQSDVEFIQGIIDEAHNYIETRKKCGHKGGVAKASKAIADPSLPIANSSLPLASSSNSSSNNKRIIFKKPTVAEIKEYCAAESFAVDAEYFYDHYESNGWKISGKPMVDWQATCRNWHRRNFKSPNTTQQPKPHVPSLGDLI